MFDRGNGPGIRADRFGTWALLTFLPLAVWLGATFATLAGAACVVFAIAISSISFD